jgi:hypothetical protein
MVKISAGLVRRAVKTHWKYEVGNFFVHAAKIDINFRFWKIDLAFFRRLHFPDKKLNF